MMSSFDLSKRVSLVGDSASKLCEECGCPQFECRSGWVCRNGHMEWWLNTFPQVDDPRRETYIQQAREWMESHGLHVDAETVESLAAELARAGGHKMKLRHKEYPDGVDIIDEVPVTAVNYGVFNNLRLRLLDELSREGFLHDEEALLLKTMERFCKRAEEMYGW